MAKDKKKQFKQKVVKVNGVEYTLQKMPVKQALDIRAEMIDMSTGEVDMAKMYDAMIEHVIVNPKVSYDDFEEVWEVDELVEAAIDFQYGKKKK